MAKRAGLGVSLSVGLMGLMAGAAVAQDKEVVVGLQCDRTGATQIVGTTLCPAYHDYVALVNSKGGIEGYKVKVLEIDHEYKVPPGMEAHERFKKEGAVLHGVYGTPHIAALNKKLEEDKMPGTSPGFGTAAAADGKKYPYTFPIAASYWSQGAAAVKFVKDALGGSLKGKKIAYLYFDNPAGKEPIAVLEDLAATEGFEVRTFAVPSPGVEMAAQVLDITGRFKPDFIITHLFGRSPSVSIKELKGKGYPLSKVVALVWGAAEADIIAAGGFGVAEGYNAMQFAGVGPDYAVIKESNDMYKAEGKPARRGADQLRQLQSRCLPPRRDPARSRPHRLQNQGRRHPTGQDVKTGFEKITNLALGDLVPPLHMTADDHEGGGCVQI